MAEQAVGSAAAHLEDTEAHVAQAIEAVDAIIERMTLQECPIPEEEEEEEQQQQR